MQPGSLPQPQLPQDKQGFYKPAQATAFGATATAPVQSEVASAPADGTQSSQNVVWDASEYIHHAKNPLWAVILIGIALICAVAAFWFQMWTFVALIVVMAIAIVVYAFRPPRTLHYELSPTGVTIDHKFYSFNDFRAFGVMPDGAFYNVILIPTQRFMPALSLYFAEEHGEKIVDILGSRLPMEQLKPDFLDAFVRKIRF